MNLVEWKLCRVQTLEVTRYRNNDLAVLASRTADDSARTVEVDTPIACRTAEALWCIRALEHIGQGTTRGSRRHGWGKKQGGEKGN